MKYLFLLTALLIGTSIQAQSRAPKEESDPEAKKILDRVRKKYQAYKTVQIDFTLTTEVPGAGKESFKGSVSQQGKMFRLEMPQQIITTDGVTSWTYLSGLNEIQINDYDPDDDNGLLSPKQLLTRYQKGDFLYAITNKVTKNGRLYTHIEFKPLDRQSDYTKLRLVIDDKSSRIIRIKAFTRDGSRFTFSFSNTRINKPLEASYFRLNPKKYPDAHVEDLRL